MGGRGRLPGTFPSARAEELNLSQWVELARVYDTNPLKDVAVSGDELFDIVDELNQVTGQGTRRKYMKAAFVIAPYICSWSISMELCFSRKGPCGKTGSRANGILRARASGCRGKL